MTYRPMASRATVSGRLPEQGRIRLGQQVPTASGKMRPDKLDTLRFTSPSRTAIDALAVLHGGEVKPWLNGKISEWQVITKTAEIAVVLPPDPLGDTPYYELWSAGGLARRCDGETVICPTRLDPNEVAMVESACICNANQKAECKVTVRLAVILPDIPFGGVWRLDTHSWNAADELPGMVQAIQNFTVRGFVRAFLGVRQEEKMEAGKKKQFIVPYLRMDTTVTEALAGGGGLAAIPAGPEPKALDAGEPSIPVAQAKGELLAACAGDKGMASSLWAGRVGPVSRFELDGLLHLADVSDGITDAELVDDDERPF